MLSIRLENFPLSPFNLIILKAGLPDGFCQTKNPNFRKFWRALDWTMLIYFVAIRTILQTIGIFLQAFMIFYDHLVHFVFVWYIYPVWVIFSNKNLATHLENDFAILSRILELTGSFLLIDK
jgi:hypothetical protein